MKKTTVGRLVAFAALLMLTVMGTMWFAASAEAIHPDNVIIDYLNETVTVKTDTDEIIYFTETYTKDIKRWDACEVRERTDEEGNVEKAAVFDISWIDNNKTVRLYLCGDVNTDVISVDIAWEETFSVEFTGTLLAVDITEAETWKEVYKKYPNFSEDTGYFIFTIEENGRDMAYFPNKSLDTVQWRKGSDGVWREFKELDLKEMNIRGINLEFRVVANAEARASSTESVAVSELNSAPSIYVNSDMMTVAIKNGMEFSFDKENWVLVPEYHKKFGKPEYLVQAAEREAAIETILTNQRVSELMIQKLLKTQEASITTNTPMNREELEAYNGDAQVFELTKEGLVVYVREIGTERKAASKISKVIVPYAAEDTAIPPVSGTEGVDTLNFSYGDSKTNSGGIVLDNKTEYKYQVAVITAEDAEGLTADDWQDLDLAKIKWTSVKPGKVMKLSNKKVPKDSYLLYRIAGENGMLPSSYQVYGPMKYDHLTYAGIAKSAITAGKTLTAVPSTNFEPEADGTYENLTFQWQSCENVKAENPEWNDIGTASNDPTYLLTNDVANQYIRVVISDNYGNIKESDYEGPVKEVKEEKPEEEEEGEGTEEITPVP